MLVLASKFVEFVEFCGINVDLNRPGCVSTPFKVSIYRCLGSDFIITQLFDLQSCLDLEIKKNNSNKL